MNLRAKYIAPLALAAGSVGCIAPRAPIDRTPLPLAAMSVEVVGVWTQIFQPMRQYLRAVAALRQPSGESAEATQKVVRAEDALTQALNAAEPEYRALSQEKKDGLSALLRQSFLDLAYPEPMVDRAMKRACTTLEPTRRSR